MPSQKLDAEWTPTQSLPDSWKLLCGGAAIIAILTPFGAYRTFLFPFLLVFLFAGMAAASQRKWWIPLLVLSIPFEISRLLVTSELESISPNRLFIGWLAGFVFLNQFSADRVRIPKHPILTALCVFFAWQSLTLLYSPDRIYGLLRILLSLTNLLVVYVIHEGSQSEDSYFERFCRFLVLLGTVWALFGVYQYLSGNLLWNTDLANFAIRAPGVEGTVVRANTTFTDPNVFGRFLILCLGANLYLLFTSRKAFHWWLSLGAMLFGILSTQSRITMLNVALPTLLGMWGAGRKGLAAMLLLTAGLAIGTAVVVEPAIFARFLELRDIFTSETSVRIYLTLAALSMFADHPILGVGAGGFGYSVIHKYSSYLPSRDSIYKSHVESATILAETGIIGFFLYLCFCATVVWACSRLIRLKGKSRIAAAIFLGVFLAIFASSNTSGKFFNDPILGVVLAMIISLIPALRSKEQNAEVVVSKN